MKNKRFEIVIENNKLFIGNEYSSGCEYTFENMEQLLECIQDYIEIMDESEE